MRSKFKEIKRRYTLINLRVSKALVGEFVKKTLYIRCLFDRWPCIHGDHISRESVRSEGSMVRAIFRLYTFILWKSFYLKKKH